MKKIGILSLILILFVTSCGTKDEATVAVRPEFSEGFGEIDEELIKEYSNSSKEKDELVTFSFDPDKYQEFNEKTKTIVIDFFKALVESDEEDYIKDIEYEDDFSQVRVFVDKSLYGQEEDYSSLVIGMYASTYRSFADMNLNSEIIYIDFEGGEIIEKILFPDM